ncbi:MAG: PP2C family protein-serine/threonine phosphatase [Terracidiphilus sp.]|jgi:sigma-B regulation protein RsbU (phosphoserine phosphatase)
MILIDAPLTANEVLRTFHSDEPYLFLGAAFTTVGVVSIGFCILRRRFDALLVWFAVFAYLYGQRMWLDAGLLHITLGKNEFIERLRWAVDFSVPIPAFLFFQATGLLPRRGKFITAALCLLFLSLTVTVSLFGRMPALHIINNVVVIVALPWILVRTFLQGKRDHDFVVLRLGLACFVVLALWDNTLGPALRMPEIEPYGFAILLCCLGYVAAHRMLRRDSELLEIQNELVLARRIQLSILPGAFPASTGFRVAARYVPMTSVAGDLYDFLVTGDSHAGLLIADVSGHGVPAALIASMVKMAAISQRGLAAHPAQLLTGMNAALCGNTQGQFVTAAYVHLDANAHQLRYAAAGHPPMLMLRNGAVTEVAENGLLLAAADLEVYSEKTLPLEPGDRLLLYTDGIVEARNAQGKLFGEDALIAELRATTGVSSEEAADRIIASTQKWAKSQDDDLTVLVCDFIAAREVGA